MADDVARYNPSDLEHYFVEQPAPAPTPTAENGTGRKRSGLPVGLDTWRFVDTGAPLLGDAEEAHLKNKTQRQRLIDAIVNLYGHGYDAPVIKEMVWQGISRSPTGDPARPWTREEVDAIVDDVVSRPAPEPKPLEPSIPVVVNRKRITPNGDGPPPSEDTANAAEQPAPWEPPIDLGHAGDRPAFPVHALVDWQREYVTALAT